MEPNVAGRVSLSTLKGKHMRNIIYLVGLVVIVLAILSFIGIA